MPTASSGFALQTNGDLEKFEADRYYINNNHSSLEKWQVTCINHKTINGIRIPIKIM
jgi:hypothetical protein